MQNTKTIILGLIITPLLISCTNQGEALGVITTNSSKAAPSVATSATIPTPCSAQLLRPAVLREETTKVLVYDGSASYTNIPAEVVWSETTIQVEPARYAQETEPAQYEEIEEVIETERARSELYASQAEYQTVVREILITPEHKRWKTGCMAMATPTSSCLETVQAEFAKISTQIIKEPAQIKQHSIPAKTIKLKRKKLLKAGKGMGKPLPARYEKVKIVRVSKPWKVISSLVEAQYETISSMRKLRDEQLLTMPIACPDALKTPQIQQIQMALMQNGQALTLSGVLDAATINAIHAFQAANRLAIGGISRETLRKLGLA